MSAEVLIFSCMFDFPTDESCSVNSSQISCKNSNEKQSMIADYTPQIPEPSLSLVLCGSTRIKCKHNNIASVRKDLACHTQNDC